MKQLITLLAGVVFCYTAFATTFTVTSNADSGPGTLREAITMANANGNAVTDYIYFNIPQPVLNMRMIELVTELPSISSNIIIDGTTQPGDFYGTTDAKVCIKKNDYAPEFSMLKVENAQGVEIYGMVLYYGYLQGLFSPPFRSTKLYGINLINSSNIQLGDAGKGNVITGVVHGIFSDSNSCSDIFIKNNYLGHAAFYSNTANEIDQVILMSACAITLSGVKNISIGGDTPAEGNIFGTKTRAISIDSRKVTGNGFVTIRNNIFGRKYDKTTLITIFDFWDTYINIGRSRNNPVNWTSSHVIDYKISLLDNDIPNHARFSYISDSMIVKRNRFIIDQRDNGHPFKLIIYESPGGGIIGGSNSADSNLFANKLVNNHFNSVGVYNSGPITILKNIFDCNSYYRSTTYVEHVGFIPFVQVDTTASTFVKGRAATGAKIDLYYDDYCTACEGLSYLATVIADATGHWTYNGTITGTVIATATSAAGYTSAFSAPEFNTQNKIVKHPTCGKNNGSITNITSEGAETYFWLKVNQFGGLDTAGHNIDLLNAGAGEYILYGVHGGTCISPISTSIKLEDITPKLNASSALVTHPACGLFNGAVSGITVSYNTYSIYKWINSAGQTIGTNLNINLLGPGTYRFVLLDTTITGGCSDTATFVLVNQSGPSLNTNNMVINAATCSNANGSITGIGSVNVTGTAFIQWQDSLNNPVGNALDLLNVMPGKYRLKFKDQSACDTIITSFYIITDAGGITIDTVGKIITPSKCAVNSGSIVNIHVTNGQNYSWINLTTNTVAGNSLNIYNLPTGNYKLTITNSNGCSKQSPVITVLQTSFVPIAVTSHNLRHALCLQNNGAINVTTFSNTASLFNFRWADSVTAQTVGSGSGITNLTGGIYQLFATDTNGCQQKIFSAAVKNMPLPVFDYTNMQLQNDQCNLSTGSINNIAVANLNGPSVYTWVNQNNVTVGNNINLQNLTGGTYILNVTDAGVCNLQSVPVILVNTDAALPAPLYDNLVIPRYSAADFFIKSAVAGSYLLLPAATASIPLQQNSSGNFTVSGINSDTVFYIKQSNGTCISPAVAVTVKVVDKSYFAIPNAFTPNGDGINDRLNVRVIGIINLIYFKVYNKWGELVFETRKFTDGWDGKYKGELQNTGSYIWIAEGRDIQGNLLTDKGMFTLIR